MITWNRLGLCLVTCFAASSLVALQNSTEIAGFIGYRSDKVHNAVPFTALPPGEAPFDGVASADNNFQAVELGIKGRLAFDCHWYVRGSGDYGILTSGTLRLQTFPEVVFDPPGTFTEGDTFGHVVDGELALGYLFCFGRSFGIAPVFGWEYNEQFAGMRNVRVVEPDSFPLFKRNMKTSWSGPFLGVDLEYQCSSCITFSAGYEYHVAKLHGTVFITPQEDLPDGEIFKFTSRYTRGNVVYLCGDWRFAPCWMLGLEGKYHSFGLNRSGPVEPAAVEDEFTNARLGTATWRSVELQLSLAYHF